MKRNANGSVTLYVGPNLPQGLHELDSHTGQTTDADNALLRSDGPDALNKKTFKMPDLAEVK
jgi:hypothetical protein